MISTYVVQTYVLDQEIHIVHKVFGINASLFHDVSLPSCDLPNLSIILLLNLKTTQTSQMRMNFNIYKLINGLAQMYNAICHNQQDRHQLMQQNYNFDHTNYQNSRKELNNINS